MKELHFNVYGVSIRFQTTNCEFSEFVAENYSVFSADSTNQPDITVTFTPESMERASQASSDHSHLGNNVYISENSIFWKNNFGFRVLVEDQSSQIEVFGYHQELIEGQERSERYKNYQRCMRWILHYPLFTLFQYRRDWGILHGAAVTNGQQTVVLCGLNKIGKSTLATYLCCERGYDLITDNYLLYDGEQIYAFPELLRLDERSIEMYNLTPLWEHKIYEKFHILPKELGIQTQAIPDAFFILTQGNHLRTHAIESKKAWQTMNNLHSMLGEFPEYGYMAAWPLVSEMTRGCIDEHDLLYQTPWYLMTYEPNWDIETVIREIDRCI